MTSSHNVCLCLLVTRCVMLDVTAGTGRSLYICGVPGTGKTATTMEVVQRYKQRPDTKVGHHFV